MKNKNVIISGISGQDGLFLTSELLKNSNISVYGVTRSNNHEDFFRRLSYIDPGVNFSNIKLVNIDLKNFETTKQFISEVKPGMFFNLTGPSSVFESIRTPKLANDINKIFNNIVDSLIIEDNFCPFFQASSSEMFGLQSNIDNVLNEKSSFNPNSPYAIAKYDNHKKIQLLRNIYNWPICSGIMFNHESEFRTTDFLIMKIVFSAFQISRNLQKNLEVGSFMLQRDWGYAKDYSSAMNILLEKKMMDDFVISTGDSTSVKEILDYSFSLFNLNWKQFVSLNPTLSRSEDPITIKSSPQKIKEMTGWSAEHNIFEVVEKMALYISKK